MRYPTLAGRGFVLPSRIQASYQGAEQGRRSATWKTPPSGPTAAAVGALQVLRNRSRALARDNPYAEQALSRYVANIIGTGITPRSKHPDTQTRHTIHELWNDWTQEADADGRTDYYGLQALICRALFESGECFVRLRPRRLEDGLAVPLQLQVLEADHVPFSKNETLANGNVIRAGIEFNKIGERVAYHMYRTHPGDRGMSVDGVELVPVPADRVLHIYEAKRPGQLRGVPLFSSVLIRLKTLEDFDDAVLFRQEVANLFTAFIEQPAPTGRPDPFGGVGNSGVQLDDDGYTPMVALEPGTMQLLQPGEKVHFSAPPDAGNNYADFMRQQLMSTAAGLGLPYEVLSGDLKDISDRVLRIILVEWRRALEQRQHITFVPQLCRPVWHAWMDAAVLAGELDLPGYAQSPRAYRRVRWVPQGWAYTHPVQDVQADRMRVRAGFTSRDEVALRQGENIEQIDAENAADQARADQLGLIYDSDPRHQARDGINIKED